MSKEIISKVSTLHADIAKAISEGKTDDAIAKLEEATTAVEGLSQEAEVPPTPPVEEAPEPEAIEKAVKTELKKYADLYVSANDFKSLMDQFQEAMKTIGSLTDINKTLESRVEAIEKQSVGSQQVVAEAPIQKARKSANELSGFFG